MFRFFVVGSWFRVVEDVAASFLLEGAGYLPVDDVVETARRTGQTEIAGMVDAYFRCLGYLDGVFNDDFGPWVCTNTSYMPIIQA